jgi:hypothetical protein
LWIVEKGPVDTIGDAAGEKVKFCWKGPADVKIGSSLILKVSKFRDMWLFRLPGSEYAAGFE